MLSIPATHIRTGHAGEVQQREPYVDPNGATRFRYYFEDHARPTAAGWYHSRDLIIPGVNA